MAKVKLNLSTGANVEKPVVTCFNVDDKKYLILDAESIGSMGLPIILVCKIENDTVKKIVDPTEWQQAKDYLKGIIAGNNMNYVPVSQEMVADEVYYTQLTLPVASFDVIKNSYKVESAVNEESVASESPVVEPVIPTIEPTVPVAPVIPEVPANEPNPVASITPVSSVIPETPVIDPVIPEIPVVDPVPVAPVIEPINSALTIEPVAPIVNEAPIMTEAPVSTEESVASEEIDFATTKEAFMKACENMFDALVSKFQAQLDSKK